MPNFFDNILDLMLSNNSNICVPKFDIVVIRNQCYDLFSISDFECNDNINLRILWVSRSIVFNLIVFNNYILKAFEDHSQVDAIFTNFGKAFGRVDYHILMDVLYKIGFGEPILSWFKSYLSCRVQWDKAFGHKLNVIEIYSGILQGDLSLWFFHFLLM